MKKFLLRKLQPNSSLWKILLGIILVLITGSPYSTYAQTDSDSEVTMSAVAGLDGYCKQDRWMPVRVTLENTGADQEGRVEALLVNGLQQWAYAQQVTLPAVSRKEVTVYTFPSVGTNSVTVSYLTEDGVVAQTTQNLSCVQSPTNIVGVWASSPSVYNIFTTLNFPGGRTSVAQLEMSDIPSHAEGFDMLNMLIIADVDTGGLSDVQRQSLTHWVENGGRLVIAGGPGWQKTSAGLRDILPFIPDGTVTLPDLNGLQLYSPENEPLVGEAIITTGEPQPSALVLASQDERPLIVRQKFGFGDVFFLAADPALAPLRTWIGIEDLYQNIFSTSPDVPSWANGFISWFEASTAVSNVPGLGLPSIFLICGFLGLYILALGPVNYLVLRQLKRRELAWISIPLLVVVFSAVAFVLGIVARGTRPIINHLAIVQVWPEQEQASVHGLVGVFSPNRSQYNVEVEGNFLTYPIFNNQLGATNSWQFLQSENGATAENVRIDVGGIEGVALSGQVPAPDFSSNLAMNFSAANIVVQGEVVNNSGLTLKDAVVVGPGQVQQVGDFQPGARENITLRFPATSSAAPNTQSSPLPAYSYDTTLNDFFGTSYIYNSADQDLARRFYLLQAALGYGGSRGGGIYLLGWTDSSPLEVNLDGKGFREEHTSIYILALTPSVQTGNTNSLTLPPALFSWSILDNNSYTDVFPYNSYLYEGVYSFRFQLNQAIAYQDVEGLTFHLTNFGAVGDTDLTVSLWNFSNNQWEELPVETWGNHDISEPEKFVGPGGEIRLQLKNPFQTSVNVERSDFTLIVEQ